MQALSHHHKNNLPALALGVCFHYKNHETMYLVAELSGRTCQLQVLEPVNITSRSQVGASLPHPRSDMQVAGVGLSEMRDAGVLVENSPDEITIRQHIWQLPVTLRFVSSVRAIGNHHDDVVENATDVRMFVVNLTICIHQETLQVNRVQYKADRSFYVAKLLKRKPYTKRDKSESRDHGDNTDNDNEDTEQVDGDEEFAENEYEEIEREIHGEDLSAFDELMEELKDDELGQDLFELDEVNASFIAAARNKQGENLSADHDQDADSNINIDDEQDISFEDELGEELLQRLHNRHGQGRQSQPARPNPNPSIKLSEDQVQTALDHWSRKMTRLCEACQLMADGLEPFEPNNPEGCLSRDVSLLLHETDTYNNVSLVTWVKPYKTLSGRVVSVDEDSCLIYPSHFVPKRTFHNGIMIVPHCGVRIKKQERDGVPEIHLYLQKLFEVGLTTLVCSTMGSDHAGLASCLYDDAAVCSSCVACGHGDTHGALRQCAACFQWWHKPRSDQVASFVSSYVATRHDIPMLKHYNLSTDDLPFILLFAA